MILLERLRHWQGELLKSRDFRDQLRYAALLRAGHNRGLHNVPGIASGLAVVDGHVTCGFGYDCAGREILIQQRIAAPALQRAGTQILIASPLGPGQASQLEWVDEWEWDGARGLALARASLQDGAVQYDAEFQSAGYVRAIARPRLATGHTVVGNTPWELWTENESDIGVQTRVDTSAAGFTETPHYSAALQAARWPLKPTPRSESEQERPAAEFAPAYFAHVANASQDGFDYRLMLQVGLRRHEHSRALARIESLDRDGNRCTVQLDSANQFVADDVLVAVRPRGEFATRIVDRDGDSLILESALPIQVDEDIVLGRLPRQAEVQTADPGPLVITVSAPGATTTSIVARRAGGGLSAGSSRVKSIAQGKLTLRDSWPDLLKDQTVRFFHKNSQVKLIAAQTDGESSTFTVENAAGIVVDDEVLLSATGKPGIPSHVTTVVPGADANESVLTVKPAIPAAKTNDNILVSKSDVNVLTADRPAGEVTIVLTAESPFLEGDLIKPAGDASKAFPVGTVDKAQITVMVPAASSGDWVKSGGVLTAGNFIGGITVVGIRVAGGKTVVQVERPEAVRAGDYVGRFDGAQVPLTTPVRVDAVTGVEIILADPIASLTVGQTLVIIRFPEPVRVVAVLAPGRYRMETPVPFRPGDLIALASPPDDTAFTTGEVLSVAADTIELSRDLGATTNSLIALVDFRDVGKVASLEDEGRKVKTEPNFAVHDLPAILATYSFFTDNASTATVESVAGDSIVVKPMLPNAFAAEGWLPEGHYDAGLVAFASLGPDQRRFVLEKAAEFSIGEQLTLGGTGGLETPVSVGMTVAAISGERLTLAPMTGMEYDLRPERSSLVSRFNSDFPRAFAVFAQRQGLYVSWFGLQQEPRTEPGCDVPAKEDTCH